MIDIEQISHDLLCEKVPEIEWSASYPQEFERHGIITQMDNSVKVTSTKLLDHVSSVAVQFQIWLETPEERNNIERRVDYAMQELGMLRSTPNHLTDIKEDGTALYRSVLLYKGSYDNNTNIFFRR